MKKILIGQQKGGVGKSTLTGNLAVGLLLRGHRVIIVDTDKQQTCVRWGSRRKLNNIRPEVAYASLMVEKKGGNEQFLGTLEKLEDSRQFEYCLLDAGGRDNRELRLGLYAADVLLAPTLPSQPDVESLGDFDDVVGEVLAGNPRLQCLTVINKANTSLHFSGEIELARNAIAELDHLSTYVGMITDRPNFRSSWLDGKTAYDLETDSAEKAKFEIEQVINAL